MWSARPDSNSSEALLPLPRRSLRLLPTNYSLIARSSPSRWQGDVGVDFIEDFRLKRSYRCVSVNSGGRLAGAPFPLSLGQADRGPSMTLDTIPSVPRRRVTSSSPQMRHISPVPGGVTVSLVDRSRHSRPEPSTDGRDPKFGFRDQTAAHPSSSPTAIRTQPASRAPPPGTGTSFSTSTKSVSPAIHGRLITPPKKSNPIKTQQHPRQ